MPGGSDPLVWLPSRSTSAVVRLLGIDRWESRTVGGLTRAFTVFVDPEIGRVELTYQTFDVRDVPAQQLLVDSPAPGSRSAEAPAYLASVQA